MKNISSILVCLLIFTVTYLSINWYPEYSHRKFRQDAAVNVIKKRLYKDPSLFTVERINWLQSDGVGGDKDTLSLFGYRTVASGVRLPVRYKCEIDNRISVVQCQED